MNEKLDQILAGVDKPARYIGEEINTIHKNWDETKIKFAIALADLYEVGMSNLGINIIYELLNRDDNILVERVFNPWPDFEEKLKNNNIPLYSLESKRPIKEFDFFGISLPTEFTFSNVLTLLDLALIPIFSSDRGDSDPIVFGGGSATFNPEPVADFFDFFIIGESEECLIEVFDLYKKMRGVPRNKFLEELAKSVQGIYVPSLYSVNEDNTGRFNGLVPKTKHIAKSIRKRVVNDVDKLSYPSKPIVPLIDIIHNRAVLEIMRSCPHKCRFCQACYTTLPVRELPLKLLEEKGRKILDVTGHEEISLVSLSSSDYAYIEDLTRSLMFYCKDKNISISLPAMRLDTFSQELAVKIQEVRSSSVTLAPEAGSQRLRNIINKKISEDDIYNGIRLAVKKGIKAIKLYFMIGLPYETDKDIEELVNLVINIEKDIKSQVGKKFKLIVSISGFIPKPHTPFQWAWQMPKDIIEAKLNYLKEKIRSKNVKLKWADINMSILEGVLARGDRKLSKVILRAWERGARFDGWYEKFDFEKWQEAFREEGVDYNKYFEERDINECLPWNHIDTLVNKEFLKEEYLSAKDGKISSSCKKGCHRCQVCT